MKSKEYNIALDCVDKNGQSLHNKHKPALIYVKEGSAPVKLNFANVEGLTHRMANAFRNLGLEKGQRIVLRLQNCPEFPITFLAAIKAGLIPIPTSPLLTWKELKFILEDSEAASLIMSDDLIPDEIEKDKPDSLKQSIALSPQKEQIRKGFLRWQDLLKNSAPEFTTIPTLGEDPAFWLYTSGTEGKPKAVIHAHRSIPAHDARAKLWQDLRFNDVIFNTSSLHWSYALTSGLLDLWRHGLPTVIYQGHLSAEKICHLIKHFGVTTFMSVPGIYHRLVEYLENNDAKKYFSQVRVCNSAGEKLTEEVRKKFKELTGLEIYEGLGMTEHSVYLCQRVSEEIIPHSCGKPIPDQKISIVDELGNELPAGTPGILASHRSCPGLMLGYHQRPDEETKYFSIDYFLSGDLAQQDEEGNFFFLGRRDDILTAGGYRISPLEIEVALNEIPDISESAVVDKELIAGKTSLAAYLVLDKECSDPEAKIQEIRSALKDSLASYKIPKEFYFVESLPKTSNGKIQRKLLRD